MDLDEAFGKLSEFNIKDHCHVNTNEDGDRFVGIKADTDDAMVYFPIGYQLPDEDKAIRNDIRHLYRFCPNSQHVTTDCLRLINLLHHNLLIFQSMRIQV